MYTGQVATISNTATWLSDVCELFDPDDGTTTNLATVSPLSISVIIKARSNGYRDYEFNASIVNALVTASIMNGKVTVPGPGFQWQFLDTDLRSLCPGTYRLIATVTMNGFVQDVIDGTITVIQGS